VLYFLLHRFYLMKTVFSTKSSQVLRRTVGLLLLGVLLTDCQSYLDINTDPGVPQSAEAFAIMPPVIQQMARGLQFDSRYTTKYTQNWAEATNNNVWDLHGYAAGSDVSGEKWRSHYFSIGLNIDLIINDAAPKLKWDYVGAAKAIRAWSWQVTTDFHGEMILKQAWEPNRYVFDFDSQEEVYAEVVKLCNESLTELNKTDGSVSVASLRRGDPVYQGDRTKWIKFVNGVLARNALHLSNKANFNPDRVIEFVDKSFANNSDNFNIPFAGNNTSDANFFGPLRNNLGTFRQSAYIVSLLDLGQGNTDPRLPLMLTASPDGVYRGVIPGQGDPNNVAANTRRVPTPWGVQITDFVSTTTPGKYVFRNNAPYPVMTYAELQFIKAEAALRKGDRVMALDAFRKAITAHMDFTGVATADRNRYLASAAVPQRAEDLQMNHIMTQKYIALWVHGTEEIWVDMRRFQYNPEVFPNFTLPTSLFVDNNSRPAQRVRPRFNSEYVWNRASLERIGGNNNDYHTYEMWFSKR
jgi:Starch-binding associating with outer membrane